MLSKKQYQAYALAMQTVAGTRQVVMLYDGIIRFLQLAREAMREGRIEDRYRHLARSSQIVFGLQSCLDFEKGGDIARILYNFYSSIDLRIFGLHRSNDLDTCDQLITEVKQMRDVWSEIDATPPAESSGGAAPEQPEPPPGDIPPVKDAQAGVAISA